MGLDPLKAGPIRETSYSKAVPIMPDPQGKTGRRGSFFPGDLGKGYDPAFFPAHFHRDNGHFWFRSRNRILDGLVKQITLEMAPGYRVLEVGCGVGTALRMLHESCDRGRVFGMDLFGDGLKFASRQTLCPLVQGEISRPPFKGRFDLICLLDVLEHVENDVQAIDNLRHLLKDGGYLLVTVPAHPYLWSYADDISCHHRRYEPEAVEKKIAESGYRVSYCTEFMVSSYPLVRLGRRLANGWIKITGGEEKAKKRLVGAELYPIPVLNGLLTFLLSLEKHWIVNRRHLPKGTSILILARKE